MPDIRRRWRSLSALGRPVVVPPRTRARTEQQREGLRPDACFPRATGARFYSGVTVVDRGRHAIANSAYAMADSSAWSFLSRAESMSGAPPLPLPRGVSLPPV